MDTLFPKDSKNRPKKQFVLNRINIGDSYIKMANRRPAAEPLPVLPKTPYLVRRRKKSVQSRNKPGNPSLNNLSTQSP